MSLRDECIEALYPFVNDDYDPDRYAADALDAILNLLEERADEWRAAAGGGPKGSGESYRFILVNARDLLAVLRSGEDHADTH